jgi:hypothetical protein
MLKVLDKSLELDATVGVLFWLLRESRIPSALA